MNYSALTGNLVRNLIMDKIKEVEEPNIPSKIGSMNASDKVPEVSKDLKEIDRRN